MGFLDQAKKQKKETKPTTAKTGSVPVIEAPDENFAEAVDKVREAITTSKKAKADFEQYGGVLIEKFLELKEEEARKMNFRKSFKFTGAKHQVMVKHANKSLKINYDDIDTIKDILTEDEFKMLIQEKLAVDVKPEVLIEGSPLNRKLWNMLGDDDKERGENFDLFFEADNSLKIKPDFDRNIFQLATKAFHALAVYVKLQKPGLQ